MNEITKAIYRNDIFEKGGINSCEIFLEKVETRIVNSVGVDASSVSYQCMVEFITTWKEEGEEIELYRCVNCSDFDADLLASEVKNMIAFCRDKAIATPTPVLHTFPVILTREAVKGFFSYYHFKSSASYVYDQYSTWKVGDQLQGEKVKGDRITITLDPQMNHSTVSASFDEDGFALSPIKLIDQGVLKQYAANMRYAHYLGVEPTGSIGNLVVESGSKTAQELLTEPHLMAAAFSDFSMDELTGDFCGEIRLAWYYDGEKTIPVTGGSISGNVSELHHEIYLSKERQNDNDFEGPLMVKIMNCTIAGVE
jgi:PmbA protein